MTRKGRAWEQMAMLPNISESDHGRCRECDTAQHLRRATFINGELAAEVYVVVH